MPKFSGAGLKVIVVWTPVCNPTPVIVTGFLIVCC
jgi:hypothetical protein